jgi:hypothetical protein
VDEFVPREFDVPLRFETPLFALEPLSPGQNDRDYDAWTSSMEHIHATPGWQDSNWPREMTPDDNRADLQRHADDFRNRRGFTYTVLDPASRDVIGCVYIYPHRDSGYEACVHSWVRASHAHLDAPLWRAVSEWLASDWPFGSVEYAVRAYPTILPEGVYHWTATHPEWEGPVSAYAIDDGVRLILIDPIAVPDNVRALFGSREVVTVLTSTWHERDAAALAFPVWAPAPDRPEDQLVTATRYAIGDSLFGMEAYPGREGQLDLVLWSERIRAVIAGDTLVNLGKGLEIPARWLPEGVTVEQVAAGLRPLLDKPVEIVLPTHGEPTDRAALERALA